MSLKRVTLEYNEVKYSTFLTNFKTLIVINLECDKYIGMMYIFIHTPQYYTLFVHLDLCARERKDKGKGIETEEGEGQFGLRISVKGTRRCRRYQQQ